MIDRRSGTKEPVAMLAELGRFARSRNTVREAGIELALSLDTKWEEVRSSPLGPVDVVDMFSGCGGMSAGFLAANTLLPAYRLAMAIDIDAVAMKTYEMNLGLKPLNDDLHAHSHNQDALVRMVNASRRAPDAPLVLIGCAPCQGFSSHRNAGGAADVRNSLFVRRASRACEPFLP
ncbi:MAG: hypothetical protein CFE33_16425 [Pseudorhodobacter sp. PARRP1]|nr:MAG: hypothetical protein CFE33_16425 [Pseudorhodobacter sp. PARRP1]